MEMKCREFAGVVHELARREQLDPAVAAIARAHAEACPHCGCRLAEARHLASLVQSASAESRNLAASPRVEQQLLSAFRREHASRRGMNAPRRFAWRAAFVYAGAVAAAALLSFVLLNRVPDRRPSPVVRQSADATVSSPASHQTVIVHKSPAGSSARIVPVQATETNIASEFVPVPYAGRIAPGDSAVIVRVQVPRTALAELGYPVDESQGSGIVQADLLVGEDGWPHAVRIVR
jgi:hypothetical protein